MLTLGQPTIVNPAKPSGKTRPYFRLSALFALGLGLLPVGAQEKFTFQDHVLPIFEANCAKCHNPDKKKADLDVSTFAALMKGSGSGPVVVSGNPDGSKLWRSLAHAEEPFMPPNRPKLPDKELDAVKKWIAGGLLENAGAKAIAAPKPGLDLELKADAIGRPDGPPPMPPELPLDPVVHTLRGNPVTGLAASPWAPVVAAGGQKQVLLYHIETLGLLGILPFPEGQPECVKFSQNGKILVAGGGLPSKSGRLVLWDITAGECILTLGSDEYDSFLAADIRPNLSQVAAGGPGRLLKVYATQTGALQHKIKKHTDWVTAVAFSPNGQMLASADRNGGICVWDPDSAQELFTFSEHKAAVTSLSWRPDSKLLASSSEDGTVKLWEFKEGKQVKSWSTHGGGCLSVSYAADGQLVTAGRDNAVTLWDANGGNPRKCDFFGNLPTRAVFGTDSKRIVASDFAGRIAVWTAADQKRAGELDGTPVPIQTQLAAAQKTLSDLQARADEISQKVAAAETELAKAAGAVEEARKLQAATASEQAARQNEVAALSQQVTNAPADLPARLAAASNSWGEARSKAADAQSTLEARLKELGTASNAVAAARSAVPGPALAEAKTMVARLEAAAGLSEAYSLRQAVRLKKQEHETATLALDNNRKSLQAAEQELAAAKAAIQRSEERIKAGQAEIGKLEPSTKQLAEEVATKTARLEALLNRYRAAAGAAPPAGR